MNDAIRRIRRIINLPLLYSGSYKLLKFVSVTPDWAEVRVTEGCNSRCITCDAWKNPRESELTTVELIDALRQLKRIGVKVVRFSGGESLTRSDLPELVRECRHLRFNEIQIATNGLLLEKKAEQLVMKGRGVVRFDVSLDGIGETDNMIRGIPDHYSRVLVGIKKVKRLEQKIGKRITITVFTTLLKHNISEVPLILELCERIGARWCFSLLCGNIDFFKEINVSNLAPTDGKIIDQTIDYLKKKFIENPYLLYSNLAILEYARQYMKGNLNLDNYPCVLGYHAICLGSKGQVYPGCYSNKPIDNIRQNKLDKILKSEKYRKFVEKMYRRECCSGCTFYYEASVLIRHKFKRAERIREILRSK